MLENPVSIAVHMQFDDTTDDTAVNVLEEEKGDNFDESSADEGEEESTLLEGEIRKLCDIPNRCKILV